MKHIKGIVLCEGDSDQVLLGTYLAAVKNMTFVKQIGDNTFAEERVIWYSDRFNQYIGIWNVGGHDFSPTIQKIMQSEFFEHKIESIVVITDYDDESAEQERVDKIFKMINETVAMNNYEPWDSSKMNNQWIRISFTDSFSQQVDIKYCYLLVPYNSYGALETYMLNSLSENDDDKKDAILQVKEFVESFKSERYLRKRREKIKAELSVSVAVFNPGKMFDTMKELINSVDWTQFDQTEKQFGLLKEI